MSQIKIESADLRRAIARQRQRAAEVRLENARKAGKATPNLLTFLKKDGK